MADDDHGDRLSQRTAQGGDGIDADGQAHRCERGGAHRTHQPARPARPTRHRGGRARRGALQKESYRHAARSRGLLPYAGHELSIGDRLPPGPARRARPERGPEGGGHRLLRETGAALHRQMSQDLKVDWVEVGPRDGLQSWPRTLPTPAKVGLVASLLDCGFRRVEATSMVHPKWVPQLADAEAVLEALQDRIDQLRVLVPNRRGLDRARDAGVRNVAVTVAATEGYNEHNLNRSVRETLEEIQVIAQEARRDRIAVDASVSVAFGCPYEGEVAPERVAEVAAALADGGIDEISLADTIGVANPAQVEALFQAMKERLPAVRWGAHFHDTRGTAIANLLSALETGVNLFEGSVGGIGGSPFAPGAAGNICSEDALAMLDAMGIATGVDVARLIAVARGLERTLDAPLPGRIHTLAPAEIGTLPA